MGDILSKYDILGAFWVTIQLSVLSAIGALVIGTIVAILRVSPVRVLRLLGTSYVNVFRNTPLTLLMVFSILGLSFILGLNLSQDLSRNSYLWAIVVLSIYHAAFVCEALRSGVNTVPAGQAEAARAIGMTFTQNLRNVVLPQAIRASVPPLASTFIAMTKNTSVAAVFGLMEATGRMRYFTNRNADETLAIFMLFAVGYIVLVELISLGSFGLERRWKAAR